DLDGDGDLDLVINNINDEARIYRNTTRERAPEENHFLQVVFAGDSLNRNGFGAFVELHYDHGRQQVYENNPYRGYLSTIEDIAHFGVGRVRTVDSVVVKWPNGKMQVLTNVAADQRMTVDVRDAQLPYGFERPQLARTALFRNVTDSLGMRYRQEERDYI